jgi:glycosyltransferase involved in cell wall biosynthesis
VASRFSASNVTVAVSNYNGLNIVGSCLESIGRLNAAPAEIVVLDDGSTDGSVAYLRQHFPSVRVIEMGVNSAASSTSCATARWPRARTDFVFLVDNDVTLAPDCLDQLLRGLETLPDAAVCLPHGLRARSVDDLSGRAGAALRRHEPREEPQLPARGCGQHAAFDDRLGRAAHRQRRPRPSATSTRVTSSGGATTPSSTTR